MLIVSVVSLIFSYEIQYLEQFFYHKKLSHSLSPDGKILLNSVFIAIRFPAANEQILAFLSELLD